MLAINIGRRRSMVFWGIISVLLFCFALLPKTEATPLSENEIFELMKQRRGMITSGKVVFQTMTYEWEDKEAYDIFAEELKKRTTLSTIKGWFVRNESILLAKAKKYGHAERTYIFDRGKDHLISTPCFEKVDYIMDGRVKPPILVRVDETQIPKDIIRTITSEYSYDGNIVKKYSTYTKGHCTLSIYPAEGEYGFPHHNYLYVWWLDPSLIPSLIGIEERLSKPSKDWTHTINRLSVGVYLMSTRGKTKDINEEMMINVPLGGVVNYIKGSVGGKVRRELISTGFSEVNGLVNLPGLVSEAIFQYDEEGKFLKIDQTIHLIHFWEIRPVTDRELEIFPCPSTRVTDYRFDPPHYYINDLELKKSNLFNKAVIILLIFS